MDTDQLNSRLTAASEGSRYAPDVPAALGRAARLRRRQCLVSGVTVSALALGVTAGVGALRVAPVSTVRPAAAPGGPAGSVDFTVRYAPKDSCAYDLVLPAGSAPATIGLPCNDVPARAPEQDAPSGRADFVRLSGGPERLINSGGAPSTTVAVLAVSQDGTPLTATLRTLPETGETVWAMQSEGNRISDLHYVLADGRRSQSNIVIEPR